MVGGSDSIKGWNMLADNELLSMRCMWVLLQVFKVKSSFISVVLIPVLASQHCSKKIPKVIFGY